MVRSKTNLQTSKSHFYFSVLDVVKSKNSLKGIVSKEFSKQRLNHYIKNLKKLGYIKKLGYGTWQITELGNAFLSQLTIELATSKTLSTDTTLATHIDLHALTLTQPIINKKDLETIDFSDFKENTGLRNWKEQHKRILSPLGLTVTVKLHQVVTNIFSRRLSNLDDVYPLLFKAGILVHEYLKLKGIKTDIFETRCTQAHITIRNQDLEQVFSKGFTLEVDLGREQEKLIENDIPKEAKVWTDNSPFRGVETNDIGYARKYLLMPEMLEKLTVNFNKLYEGLEDYNKNLKLHLEVQEKQLKNQEIQVKNQIKMNELLEKIDKKLGYDKNKK